MERTELIETLYNYCAVMIEHFSMKEYLALDVIDRDRCPLYMASERLYNEMEDAISDYCEDNEIDLEEYDIDVEDVFNGY